MQSSTLLAPARAADRCSLPVRSSIHQDWDWLIRVASAQGLGVAMCANPSVFAHGRRARHSWPQRQLELLVVVDPGDSAASFHLALFVVIAIQWSGVREPARRLRAWLVSFGPSSSKAARVPLLPQLFDFCPRPRSLADRCARASENARRCDGIAAGSVRDPGRPCLRKSSL